MICTEVHEIHCPLHGSRQLPIALSKGLYGCHDQQSSLSSDSPEIKSLLQVTDYEQNLAGVRGSYDDHSRDLRHYQGESCSMLGGDIAQCPI